MAWTEDRVEILKTLWAEGKSASEIAKTLGGVTRNAVIGKIHRIGHASRKLPKKATKAKRSKSKKKSPAKTRRKSGKQSAGAGKKNRKSSRPQADNPPAERTPAKQTVTEKNPPATTRPKPVETVSKPPRVPIPVRKKKIIISADRPLPPQPSPNEISAEALALVAIAEKKSKRIELMKLTESTCKWPVGDPATDDFWFCGLPSETSQPYCKAHSALAYQPMSARRDRRAK